MKLEEIDPPREFRVGPSGEIVLRDCGRLTLEPDEQITLLTPKGSEYDVVRKSWGFYATPSLNARLPRLGLRPTLVKTSTGRFHVMLVEAGKEEAFQAYAEDQGLVPLCWLDDDGQLAALESAVHGNLPG